MRYIIINADDFGRHAEINRAVEQGLVHGCLRSATVMPGGAAFAGPPFFDSGSLALSLPAAP